MKTYSELFHGTLWSLMQWEQWDALRASLVDSGQPWYVYAVGHGLPDAPVQGVALTATLDAINELLRHEHRERYLGIVYLDDLRDPTLIKVYDPNHLGSVCGSRGDPAPPGWIISRLLPEEIVSNTPLPQSRKRWWDALLGSH